MRLVLFILPFLLGILGAHYALYITVVKAFGIEHIGPKLAVYLVPLFLTLSFIFANILLHFTRNALTEAYGVISVVWLGFFINLLMAVGLVWLAYPAFRLAGRTPDLRILTYAGLGLAVILSAYSAWNARCPRVTSIQVPIHDLPEYWKGRTVVQLSDVHLGTVLRTSYARDLVERVNALKPDLVLITGDLFDGMDGRLVEYAEALDGLEATHGVYYVTGNHEGYLGLAEPLAALATTDFRILDNEVVDVKGLQLVGLSFPEHNRKDFTLTGTIDPHKPSILMFHTPTDVLDSPSDRGAQQNRTYFSPDTSFTFAKKHSIDLQLSGHTHQGQFFPFTLVSRLIFGKYTYGLHRIGDFHIYTTSGSGTWGPPMRLGSRSEIVKITLEQ
jgi:hypothetical protein